MTPGQRVIFARRHPSHRPQLVQHLGREGVVVHVHRSSNDVIVQLDGTSNASVQIHLAPRYLDTVEQAGDGPFTPAPCADSSAGETGRQRLMSATRWPR